MAIGKICRYVLYWLGKVQQIAVCFFFCMLVVTFVCSLVFLKAQSTMLLQANSRRFSMPIGMKWLNMFKKSSPLLIHSSCWPQSFSQTTFCRYPKKDKTQRDQCDLMILIKIDEEGSYFWTHFGLSPSCATRCCRSFSLLLPAAAAQVGKLDSVTEVIKHSPMGPI